MVFEHSRLLQELGSYPVTEELLRAVKHWPTDMLRSLVKHVRRVYGASPLTNNQQREHR